MPAMDKADRRRQENNFFLLNESILSNVALKATEHLFSQISPCLGYQIPIFLFKK